MSDDTRENDETPTHPLAEALGTAIGITIACLAAAAVLGLCLGTVLIIVRSMLRLAS